MASKLTFVICFEIRIFEKVTSTCEKSTSTCAKVTSIRANDQFRNSLFFHILFEDVLRCSKFRTCKLRKTSFDLRASNLNELCTDFELRNSGFAFRNSSFELRNSGFEFRISSFELRNSGFEYRISNFQT